MSGSAGVQPRWKRRADEIADAIGDELSVTVLAPVDIGNDVKIHTESITALAAALPSAADIASAIWSEVGRTVAISNAQSASDPLHVELRNVQNGFTALASNVATAMKTGNAQHVKTTTGDTVDVSTAINQSLTVNGSVSASIGNATVPIRTDANGDPVDANGNVVELTVNGNNLPSVNVANGNNISVPVKATLAGIPQNTQGTAVYIPAKTVSNDPTKLANSSGNQVNVGVDVSTSSVPVKTTTGTSFAADVNGNLVEAPVSNQNLPNVLVKTLATNNTLAANAAGAAVNVPANFIGAGTLDVKITGDDTHGIIMSKNYFQSGNQNQDYSCQGLGLGAYAGYDAIQGVQGAVGGVPVTTEGWTIRCNGVDIPNQDISNGLRGTTPTPTPIQAGVSTPSYSSSASSHPLLILIDSQETVDKYHGRKVTLSSVANVWIVEPIESRSNSTALGYITSQNAGNAASAYSWQILADDGTEYINQLFWDQGNYYTGTTANKSKYIGARVIRNPGQYNQWYVVGIDAI